MAGKGVELLVSPTEDSGKILACFGQIRAEGMLNFSSAVQIAQLALKHRKNKNGGQRIIAFGGPIAEDVLPFKVGKQLKKNNVAVNVVSMGELDDNNEKLTEFINAVNSNDNSSFVVVPPGVVPVNAVRSSLLDRVTGHPAGRPGAMGAQGWGRPWIRREHGPRACYGHAYIDGRSPCDAASSSGDAPAEGEAGSSSAPSEFGGAGAATEDDEEALMQQALALSMQGMSTTAPTPPLAQLPPMFGATQGEDDDQDEEALVQQALALRVVAWPLPRHPQERGSCRLRRHTYLHEP